MSCCSRTGRPRGFHTVYRIARAKLLRRRQENFGRRQELHVLNFGNYSHALKLPVLAGGWGTKSQQILIVKVLQKFVKVRFERHRAPERQIVRFRASFFGEPAEIGLRVEDAEVTTWDVALARVINGPYVNVFFLSALDGAVQIRIDRIKPAAAIVDARRDQ